MSLAGGKGGQREEQGQQAWERGWERTPGHPGQGLEEELWSSVLCDRAFGEFSQELRGDMV